MSSENHLSRQGFLDISKHLLGHEVLARAFPEAFQPIMNINTLAGLLEKAEDERKSPGIITPKLFSVEIVSGTLDLDLLDLIVASGVGSVRYGALDLFAISPFLNPALGEIDTTSQKTVNDELSLLSRAGLNIMLNIKGTPRDVRRRDPKDKFLRCSPIDREYFGAYADFINSFLYNRLFITEIEIGNEPDVDPLKAVPWAFGCVGENHEDGEYFGEMLKVVYPKVKRRNPKVTIYAAGLALHTPDFLEGLVMTAAGNMDGLSFHAYDYPETQTDILEEKIDLVKRTLATHKVNIPIIHSEGGFLCPDGQSPCGQDFELQKAAYVIKLYLTILKNGMNRANLFTLKNTWKQSGLVRENLNPNPAFRSLQFITELLSPEQSNPNNYAFFVADLSTPSISKIIIRKGREEIYIFLWSKDRRDHNLLFPPNAEIIDMFGNKITRNKEESVEIGYDPKIVKYANFPTGKVSPIHL